MDIPHIGINKEAYREIDKNNNGKPTNDTKRSAINQKETSRYILRGQLKYQCCFMHFRRPKYNEGR